MITGTRTEEDPQRAAVRVDVITRKMAKEKGATTVAEALSSELSVDINASSYGNVGNPSGAKLGGMDADRVLVLVDGERAGGTVGGVLDLQELSLAGVNRIEVVQGPVSALYGTSAIGGVINVISGPPEREGWSGRVLTLARYRPGGYLEGSVAYRSDRAWVALDGNVLHQAGYAPEDDPPDTLAPRTTRAALGIRGGFSPQKNIDLDATFRWSRQATVGLETEEVPGLGRFFIELPETSDRFSVRLHEAATVGVAKIDVSLSKQWFVLDSVKDRVDSPIDETRTRRYSMHSLETHASFFEGEVASFLVGLRGEVETFDQTLDRAVANQPDLFEQEIVPTTLGQGSLYGQLRVDPSEAWTLFAGGRLEIAPEHGVGGAPRIGAAYRPVDEVTLRLSGGRGYRVPAAREVGFAFDHSFYGYQVEGNPGLRPETSWGGVFDAEVRPTRELTLRASGYANYIDELIDLAYARTEAGIDIYTYENLGEAVTAGGEGRVIVRAPGWARAEVGYNFLYARDLQTKLPLAGRPAHTLFTSLRLELPERFVVNARAKVVSRTYIAEGIISPPFATIDLRLAKGLWPSAEVYVGATNVLGIEKDPEQIGDQRPLEGRTLYLGIAADFPWEETG